MIITLILLIIMYINPIDISIALLLSIMMIIGIKNGIIDEFKKTINFFLSIICTKFIVSYLSNSFSDRIMGSNCLS